MERRTPNRPEDTIHMKLALAQAEKAQVAGEVPVGAVIVLNGQVVAEAHNLSATWNDLTQHAELIAIRAAMSRLRIDRLVDATLYVTLEPCAQCAGAILLSRVKRVVFGAFDAKAGMAGSVEDLLRHGKLSHRPEVEGGCTCSGGHGFTLAFFCNAKEVNRAVNE